jgi:hypothetical protein
MYEDAREQLLAAIRSHKENGGKFAKQYYGVTMNGDTYEFPPLSTTCCGIGAYLIGKPIKSQSISSSAAILLKVERAFVWGFIDAFDGTDSAAKEFNHSEDYLAGYRVGLEAAKIAFGRTEGSEDRRL